MPPSESELVLKELEVLEKEELKKKRELEKLKQKINDAAKNVQKEREYEDKVPMEQVAAETTEGLSAEEKVILAVHKGKVESFGISDVKNSDNDEDENSLEKKAKTVSDGSLEGTVAAESAGSRFIPSHNEMELAQQNYQQIVELSHQPMAQLYDQMKNIYDSSVAEGYVSGPVAAQTFELESAIERKLQDVDAGNYQFTNDQTAKAASASLSMKEKVSAMYVAGKEVRPGNDLYQ